MAIGEEEKTKGAEICSLILAFSWPLKSRLSPFAITKGRREKKEGKEASSKSNAEGSNNFERWLPFLDAKTLSGKSHSPMFAVLTTTMSFRLIPLWP
ncbi:hypothetical protein GOBAR_AA31767 [Gossypium barbadense]|uniref:Uncharacterized protein n=1 Tax=Gossypium barbadense TaxID=3634 RepID=A0A2P5WCV9_GOSBA|nr:hypothetical protein GOBAR_AA31767 [Gossypium barbadense]